MKDPNFQAEDTISTTLEKEKKSRCGKIQKKTKVALQKQKDSQNVFRITDRTYLERLRSIPL